MSNALRLDPRDLAEAQRRVAEYYRESAIANHELLYAAGRMSKTLLGRAVIGAAAVATASVIAAFAVPGLAIAGGGFAAMLMVAHSRNKSRAFETLVADTIAGKKKSGAFDQQVEVEMELMAEHQMRLLAELGGPALKTVKTAAAGAFNGHNRSPATGMPLTGGSPEVLAAMRMR